VATAKIPLVLATTNEGKAREIRAALRDLPFRVITLAAIGVGAAYPERGATFEANARGKSLHYGRKSEFLTLAEDSGLVVDALAGAPGVRSARFSGRGATDEKNNRKLLRLMEGVPPQARTARFVCHMALSHRGRMLASVRGEVRGTIAGAPRGGRGFGYDPVFYYRPKRKTFGEIPPGDKNAVSHRGRALAEIKRFLEREGPPPWGRGRASVGGIRLGGNQASRPKP
jgi:XTP/dITP diphosphohydrolase